MIPSVNSMASTAGMTRGYTVRINPSMRLLDKKQIISATFGPKINVSMGTSVKRLRKIR